jgi:hypothetical protein
MLGVLSTSFWSSSNNSFRGKEFSLSFHSDGMWSSKLKIFHNQESIGVLKNGFFESVFVTANGVHFEWIANFWGEGASWVDAQKTKRVLFKKDSVLSSSSGMVLIHDKIPRMLGVTLAICGLLVQRQRTAGLVAGISG